MLAFSDAGKIPLRAGVLRPKYIPTNSKIKVMKVNFEDVESMIEPAKAFMQEKFVK